MKTCLRAIREKCDHNGWPYPTDFTVDDCSSSSSSSSSAAVRSVAAAVVVDPEALKFANNNEFTFQQIQDAEKALQAPTKGQAFSLLEGTVFAWIKKHRASFIKAGSSTSWDSFAHEWKRAGAFARLRGHGTITLRTKEQLQMHHKDMQKKNP